MLPATVAFSLAVFVAAHAGIAIGLTRRGQWRRALACLVMPALAPWWGYKGGMRIRAIAWTAAVIVYAAGVTVA